MQGLFLDTSQDHAYTALSCAICRAILTRAFVRNKNWKLCAAGQLETLEILALTGRFWSSCFDFAYSAKATWVPIWPFCYQSCLSFTIFRFWRIARLWSGTYFQRARKMVVVVMLLSSFFRPFFGAHAVGGGGSAQNRAEGVVLGNTSGWRLKDRLCSVGCGR